ncbi:MAG: hypothetical protein JNJ91_05125 [Flavobacteriales bacterium]|nr:hypothetical protein [Flavobacteriales bacterium]
MKALKIIGAVILGIIALGLIVGNLAGPDTTQSEVPTTPEAASEPEAQPAPTVISDLNPVDVYLNLEQRGFTVTKNLKPGQLSWTCRQTWPSVEFVAETFGPEVDRASLVRATVTADGVNKTALAGRDYLLLVASVPYTGAQPQVAHDWLLANFDNDSATTSIGGATFTLYAPTQAFRMLTIQPSR